MTLANLLIILLVIGVVLMLMALRWRLMRVIVAVYGVLVLALLLGEGYFRYAHSAVDWPFVYAAQNWYAQHIDTNSYGFRDRDWTPNDFDGQQIIVVLGDDLTVGMGVGDVSQRYTDVLADLIGPDAAVINAGVAGSSTRQQLDTLQALPVTPDVLIWQIHLDDIADAALRHTTEWLQPMPDMPPLAQDSALANHMFWTLTPRTFDMMTYNDQTFYQWAYAQYDNIVVWETQQAQMHALLDHVEASGARLITLIMPDLEDPNPVNTIPYVDRVAGVLADRGFTDGVRLYNNVAALGRASLLASERVFYANADFHRHLGAMLYDRFFAAR